MLTLYKSLVMSRLEYTSQLWSPYLLKHVYLIKKVQRAFTKHISGMCFLSYSKRLEVLKLYSLQRRRERYGIIYVWKIIEGLVPNLSDPITCSFSDRRERACVVCMVQNGSPGSTRFYVPVHLRRCTGPYILGRPVKFSNSQDADNLHTIRKRMPIPFQ